MHGVDKLRGVWVCSEAKFVTKKKVEEATNQTRGLGLSSKLNTGSLYTRAKRVARGENGDAKAVALLR